MPVLKSWFGIARKDLRGEPNGEALAKQLSEAEAFMPCDLAVGPLLRANLYQISDTKWVLVYMMHPIISDGWSMSVLTNELFLFYNSYIKGEANPLSPLRIQYKDYAGWQQEQLKNGALNRDKEYWLKQLEGELPVLVPFSGDKVRLAVKTFNGGMISRTLSKGGSKGLKTLVLERGSTLFTGLLTLVNTLLYRYTDQTDIILGTPLAGRDHADLENQIGLYGT